MSARFRGAPPPAGPPTPTYYLVKIAAGEVADLSILDESIYGVDCHWVEDVERDKASTQMCMAHRGVCHNHHCPPVWAGYLAVYDHYARQKKVLCVGPETARALSKESAPHFGLRGLRLLFRRATLHPRSELRYEPSPHPRMQPVPQAHDITATLCQIFGVVSMPEPLTPLDDVPGPPDAENGGVQ